MICSEMQLFHHFCCAHAVQQILKFLNDLGGNPVLRIGVCARLPFRLLRQHQRKLSMLVLTLKIRLCHVTGHHGLWVMGFAQSVGQQRGLSVVRKGDECSGTALHFLAAEGHVQAVEMGSTINDRSGNITFKTPTLVYQIIKIIFLPCGRKHFNQ